MPIPRTLVIAWGNRLRGDDGVGPTIGDLVESWRLPGVSVRVVHQLVPELIDAMADAERVLFIDAAVMNDAPFQWGVVEPKRSGRSLGHHESPANLLALLRELEGRTPAAWLLTVAGHSFEHGESLTASANAGIGAALAWIREWLTQEIPCV